MPETKELQVIEQPEGRETPNPMGVIILVAALLFLAIWITPIAATILGLISGGISTLLGAIFSVVGTVFAGVVALGSIFIAVLASLFVFVFAFIPLLFALAFVALLLAAMVAMIIGLARSSAGG